MRFFYVKRSDGSVIDIPYRDLDETLKRHKDWQNLGEILTSLPIIEQITEEKKETAIACPLCERSFASEHGLKIHKAKCSKAEPQK